MKKFNAALLLTLLAVLTVSCSKETEPAFPESKVLGEWIIPLTIDANVLPAAGNKLLLNKDYTASYHTFQFANWKLDGRKIVLTNYRDRGEVREMEVLTLDIKGLNDSVMLAVGRYTHAYNEQVDKEGALDGVYIRPKNK